MPVNLLADVADIALLFDLAHAYQGVHCEPRTPEDIPHCEIIVAMCRAQGDRFEALAKRLADDHARRWEDSHPVGLPQGVVCAMGPAELP